MLSISTHVFRSGYETKARVVNVGNLWCILMWMVAQEENQNSFRRLLGMSLHLRCFVTLSELYLNLKIHALVCGYRLFSSLEPIPVRSALRAESGYSWIPQRNKISSVGNYSHPHHATWHLTLPFTPDHIRQQEKNMSRDWDATTVDRSSYRPSLGPRPDHGWSRCCERVSVRDYRHIIVEP